MTLPPLPRLRVPLIEADVDLLDIKVLAQWCERTATDYARAAVEAEREACARACEAVTANARQQDGYDGDYESGIEVGGDMCATAIRDRGAKEQGNSNG